ncbi:hypothetical protein HY250_01875 [Candidatus Azambacteria bacterium]|nr:hypothetical protein [Candidatus Azambacteria bacterium]
MVNVQQHVIDCDAAPFVPKGWSVEEHQKGGQFKFDPAQVRFYLSKPQQNEKWIKGNELRKELSGKPVLNANILDYLFTHPHLIPESWKKDEQGRTRHIFFWGTIYRDANGDLCVRCLYFFGGRWDWGDHWLGIGWSGRCPVALRASN